MRGWCALGLAVAIASLTGCARSSGSLSDEADRAEAAARKSEEAAARLEAAAARLERLADQLAPKSRPAPAAR